MMEILNYKRSLTGFITACTYKKNVKIGSHDCFFCHYCIGRTEDTVKCMFKDFHNLSPKAIVRQNFSYDVMVKGMFRKTISVKATGLRVINGVMQRYPTQEDINKEVEARCPHTFMYENWNVELNK